MNHKIGLLISAVVTSTTLLFFDIWKLFPTPLAGVTHWFPEMVFVFLIGRYAVEKLTQSLVLTIAFCLILYCMLTYVLLYSVLGVNLGLGASSLFCGVFLMGVVSATKM